MRNWLLVLFVFCLGCGPAAAAGLVDPRDLPEPPSFGAESAARGAATFTVGPSVDCTYNSLQTAIDAAPESAVLQVMMTYAGDNAPYTIFEKSLTIEGGYDACGPSRQRAGKTMLDPGAQITGTVLSVINTLGGSAPSRRVDLSHLIITGGKTTPGSTTNGGGLRIQSPAGSTQVNLFNVAIVGNQRTGLLNSGAGLALFVSNQPASQVGAVRNPMVTLLGTDTRIAENTTEAEGGGIYCSVSGSTGLISPLQMYQGVVELNSARSGGGFYANGCRDVVFANAGPSLGSGNYAGGFYANTASLSGGGLYVAAGGRVILLPSTYDTSSNFYALQIEGNMAGSSGGGIGVFGAGSELVLRDTWVVGNTAGSAGGIFLGSGTSLDMDRLITSRRCMPSIDAQGRSFYPPCSVIEGNVASNASAFGATGESMVARIARTRIRFNQTTNLDFDVVDVGRSNLSTGPQNQLTLIGSLLHDNTGASLIRARGPSLTDIRYSTLAHSRDRPMIRLQQIADQGPALLTVSASILRGNPNQLLVAQPTLNTDAAAECVLANRPADVSGFNSTSLYLEADPRFRDADNGDFGLADDSPAIDFCSALFLPEEVSPDLDGNPRGVPWTGPPSPVLNPGSGFYDLGALESVAPDRLFRDRFQL